MISWTRVNELRDEVGHSDFDEVVEIFLEEVEEIIDRLESNPDPTTFEQDLHFLKGSALNLGFRALSDICRDSELAINAAQADINMASVITTYKSSKTEFLAGLNTHQDVA